MQVILLVLLACSGESSPPAPQPHDPPAAPSAGGKNLEGVLTWTEAPAVQSVEAYLHVEFTLATSGGVENLAPGDHYEALKTLSGRKVAIACTPEPPKDPDPRAAAPMGPDGKPMQHPAQCRVTSVKEAH